eukprot:1150963-Pelagomonas_calceolata.AAC.2
MQCLLHQLPIPALPVPQPLSTTQKKAGSGTFEAQNLAQLLETLEGVPRHRWKRLELMTMTT